MYMDGVQFCVTVLLSIWYQFIKHLIKKCGLFVLFIWFSEQVFFSFLLFWVCFCFFIYILNQKKLKFHIERKVVDCSLVYLALDKNMWFIRIVYLNRFSFLFSCFGFVCYVMFCFVLFWVCFCVFIYISCNIWTGLVLVFWDIFEIKTPLENKKNHRFINRDFQ